MPIIYYLCKQNQFFVYNYNNKELVMNYNRNQGYDKSSLMQIVSDIGVLLLRLMGTLAVRTAKLIAKICQLTWQLIVALTQKAIVFWNSTETKEKRRQIAAWSKSASISFGKFLLWLLKALGMLLMWIGIQIWRGCVWLAKAIAEMIVHLGPTLRRLGRGLKLYMLNRKRDYRVFAQNGGVKGMLTNTRKKLHSQLDYYMNEDEENSEFVITNLIKEDDDPALGDAEFISERIGQDNKPRAIINNIYNQLKKLVTNE